MYTFSIQNKHLIADINGKRCLIDTGSPASFGNTDITINGRIYHLAPSGFGVSFETIATHVGAPIDALIGADILSKHGGLFVWNSKLELHLSVMQPGGDVPMQLVSGIPVVSVTVAGQTIDACIDTGAPYTYVASEIADSARITGQIEDFYPTIGTFTAPTVALPITDPHTNKDTTHTVAVLPDTLGSLLTMINCKAILGLDWLSNNKSHFQINYRDKMFSN